MKKVSGLYEAGEINVGYYVFLPENYDVNKKFPLVLFLHGAGERGDGSEEKLPLVCVNALPKYAEEGEEYPFILLCPQCPENIVWNNVVLTLKSLVDSVAEQYNADPERISCTGLSMGGFGTWEMGVTYPDFFAAIAPVCGGGFSWRAPLLKDMPIWAFHGDVDSVVPISYSETMVEAIKKSGGNVKFTVFPGVNHNSWDSAYQTTDVVKWLTEQRKGK